jgi:hypothetical protein
LFTNGDILYKMLKTRALLVFLNTPVAEVSQLALLILRQQEFFFAEIPGLICPGV